MIATDIFDEPRAVEEHQRHLDDLRSDRGQPEPGLDLKPVPVRSGARDADISQSGCPVGAEA